MKQVVEISDLAVQTGDRMIQLIRETQMLVKGVDFPHDVHENAYSGRYEELLAYTGKIVSLRSIAPAGRIAHSVRPSRHDPFYHRGFVPNAVGIMSPVMLLTGAIQLKTEERGRLFTRDVEYYAENVVDPNTFEPLFVAEVFEPR